MSNKKNNLIQWQSPIKIHMPKFSWNGDDKQVTQPLPQEQTRNNNGKQKPDRMTGLLYEALVHTPSVLYAYPQFKSQGQRIVVENRYMTYQSNLSLVIAEAARYIMAQQWTIDLWIETNETHVRVLSAWVDDIDSNGSKVRERFIVPSSPLFGFLKLAVDNACIEVVKQNMPTYPIPDSMRVDLYKAAPDDSGISSH